MDIIVGKEGGMTAWHCALVVSVVVLGWWRPWKIGRRDRKLPPGPPTSFLLGNALQFPRLFPHHRYVALIGQDYDEVNTATYQIHRVG